MSGDVSGGSDALEFGSKTIGDLQRVARALDQGLGPRGDEAPTRIDRVGPYRELDRVGRGGMGAVYRAVDSRSSEVVAVKVPSARFMHDPALHARFHREADAAGLLDHPGIVGFRELGEDESHLYIVSDFCDGPNLAAWIRAQAEPTPGRGAARLVAALADAVAHAHDRGVLHRDLKPSNVMLPGARLETDVEKLTPQITDFGLAKLGDGPAEGEQPAGLLLTQPGDVIGSPAYMAPEQASGKASEISRRTDVHGLGTILYTLLTGRPPFRGETVPETLRLVCEADPAPLREFRPGLSGDLDRIALRCLEKDPDDRYATAEELAEDLRRFHDGRPLDRRTGSIKRRIVRWTRRKPKLARSLAAAAVAATVLVVAGLAWTVSLTRLNNQLVREKELSDRLNYTLQLQKAQRAFGDGQIGLAQHLLRDLAPDPDAPDRREFAWRHLWRLTRREARLIGDMEAEIPFSRPALSSDGGLLALTDSEGGLGLFDMRRSERIWYIGRETSAVGRREALTADGRRLATAYTEQPAEGPVTTRIEIRDTSTGAVVARLPDRPGRTPDRLILGARGLRLWLIDSAETQPGAVKSDFRVTTWNLGSGPVLDVAPRSEFRLPLAYYLDFAVSPDGLGLACNIDGRPGVYSLTNHALTVPLADAPPKSAFNIAEFSPDGRRIAAYDWDTRVLRVWNARSGKLLHRAGPFKPPLSAVALQPGGEAFVTADEREEVHLLDPSRGLDLQIAPPNPLAREHSREVQLAFIPKGDAFLVSRHPYMKPDRIELRSVVDGRLLTESPVLQMSRMGRWKVLDESNGGPGLLYTQGRYVWCWRWDHDDEFDAKAATLRHSDEAWAVKYSRDGAILVTTSNDTLEDQTVKVWDARTLDLKRGWKAHDATVTEVSIAPDGRRLATSSLSADQAVRVWEVATGALLAAPDWPTEPARSVAFDPRGDRLAAVGSKGTVRVWNAADLTTVWTTVGHVRVIHAVDFSPDSTRIATGGDDGFVRIWDAATGAKVGEFRSPVEIMAVAFDPLGRRLAAGSNEGTVYLLDPGTAKLERVIRSDDRNVRGLDFSPDGRTLASGGLGKSIRLWDPETGQELLSLDGHKAQINALTFAPDGSALISVDHAGAVLAWRADPLAAE